jgi:CRISPR/Cas system Type II protein with McrA/HNH and RuvC-like nuclease domain
MWRREIREKWEHQCAYCGSEENLTIDHIIPQSKGGMDFTKNVVCCCHDCNQSKGHEHWKLWFVQQDFYSEERFNKIEEWMKPDPPLNLFKYRPRRNNAS